MGAGDWELGKITMTEIATSFRRRIRNDRVGGLDSGSRLRCGTKLRQNDNQRYEKKGACRTIGNLPLVGVVLYIQVWTG